MHISEGVLSAPVIAVGWVAAAGGVAWGLRKLQPERIPHVAVIAAALFLAALVRFPIGPTSMHLTLLGLAGVLLGWSAVPALFIALMLQAILFQFGGLVSLGANTTIMGVAALTGGLVFRLFGTRLPMMLRAFASGFMAVVVGTVLLCAALWLSNSDFRGTLPLIAATQLALALIEGVVTALIVGFMARSMPRLLAS
ncbi:MAG: cobalt transporter CbiM [Burkholderiales bacterium]|jgi:cobalt/nickel transport system permease protein|nr:cobalt transporter CbiM [Burkholderiales bacterium]